jgi:polyhydroxybutyrate depolymerase
MHENDLCLIIMCKSMKRVIAVKIYLIFFLLAPFRLESAATQKDSIMHNGIWRTFLLYVPRTYDGSKPFALLFALHGASGMGSTFLTNGFNERAELHDYIAIYPDGVNNVWNVYPGGGVDDIGFLTNLIDTILSRYRINAKRVYFTGHSNGSYMSYTLAAKIPGKIAAIAPVAGLLISGLYSEISVPIPILHIHSMDDSAVPYQGSYGASGVDSLLNFWKFKNHCRAIPDTLYSSDELMGFRWAADSTGADVMLYKFKSGGHTWLVSPLYITDLIVEFFFTHPKREREVRITSPLSFRYAEHCSIELKASVISPDLVSKVEYYANTQKIGESGLPPYSFPWNDIPGNDYLVYAKTLNTDGSSTTSSNPQLIHVMLPSVSLFKSGESSSGSGGFTANYAFDDDFTTRWSSSKSDTQWISVDLSGFYRVHGIALYWGPTYAPTYYIDVSKDKIDWSTVYSTKTGKGNAEIITFEPFETRYVRVYGTNRSTPWGYSIYEFGVQGEFVRSLSVNRTTGQQLQWNLDVSPNPFNPSTNIKFSIKESAKVTLKIYNVRGQEVASTISEELSPGIYTRQWNAGNLPSGVYFYRMTAVSLAQRVLIPINGRDGPNGSFTSTKKLVLLR